MLCLQLLHKGIAKLNGCLTKCMLYLQLLHEGIAKFNGYEINTEGDSFHIAFTSVAAAVQVAMETQVRLLDSDWPKDVLKLPACGQVSLLLTHCWILTLNPVTLVTSGKN